MLTKGDNLLDRNLEKYYSDYSELPFENIQEQYRKRKILDWLNVDSMKVENFLEVGCGQDSIFNYVNKKGIKYIIEPIKEMFDCERNRNLDKSIFRINSTLENSFMKLDLKFDVILVSSLIHEIHNPVKFLSNCKTLLNKNGKIVIVTNNKMSIHRILGVELGIMQNIHSRTQTENKMQQIHGAFTKKELIDLLYECGLNVNKIETFFPKLLPHELMYDAIKKNI